MTSAMLGDGKFADFFISTHTYKTVDDHPILIDVLVPKALVQERRGAGMLERPVLLRYHLGALVRSLKEQPCFRPHISLSFFQVPS